MVMLGAAAPEALKTYRKGIRTLNERFPGAWHRVYISDVLMRSGQWGRLRERRVAAGDMRPDEGWCSIINDSAFQGFGSSGACARWWEDNAWYPLTELKNGRAA